MELVRAYRFPHVNMDLIAGLPADTPEGFRRSLDKCLELGADDITIHTLALKKGSRILMEGLSIPDGAAVQACWTTPPLPCGPQALSPTTSTGRSICPAALRTWVGAVPAGSAGTTWTSCRSCAPSCPSVRAVPLKMVEPGTNHIERVFNLKYPKEYTERPEKIQQNQAAFAEFYQKYVPET